MQEPTTFEVIYQSFIAFIALFILARILGKRQIAQLTFFDYIVGLTIGNIAAAWSLDEIKNLHAVLSLAIWSLLSVVLALLQKKSYKARTLLDGRAVILMENGQILEKNLSRVHMSTEELLMLLRQKDVFKISDAEYAVFENNGKLSVLKKTELQPLTPKDVQLPVLSEHEPRILIIDGNVMEKSLQYLGYSREWLLGEVLKQGAKSTDDVFLAQVDSNGNLYVDLYYDSLKAPETKKRALLAASLKKLQADMELFALQTDNPDAKTSYGEMAKDLQNLMNRVLPYLRE